MLLLRPSLIKISESYFRIKIDFNDKNAGAILEILNSDIHPQDFFNFIDAKEIQRITSVEKGSLIGRSSVFVSLAILINGIILYGDLRSGLSQMVSDAKSLSSFVINKVENHERDFSTNILRTESRTGLTGKIKRDIDKINHLLNKQNLTPTEEGKELDSITQDLSNVCNALSQIDSSPHLEQSTYFKKIIEVNLNASLPVPNPQKTTQIMNRYMLFEVRNRGKK